MTSAARTRLLVTLSAAALLVAAVTVYVGAFAEQDLPPAKAPFSDYRVEKPGAMHKITVADLPAPFATEAANNGPKVVPRPAGAMPQAAPGYTVTLYADGLENPRLMRTAPNGDCSSPRPVQAGSASCGAGTRPASRRRWRSSRPT